MLRIQKFIKKPSNWPAVGIVLLMILALILSMSSIALAQPEYDMTAPGSHVIINGAYFEEGTYVDSAGTGVFKPFLRVHQSNVDVERGYTSDYNGSNKKHINYPEFEEDVGWTNSFLLKDVPQVPLSGITGLPDGIYREFHLDINQNSGGNNEWLSWDVFELYISDYEVSSDLRRYADAPGPNGWYTANFPDEPTRYIPVWSLDDGPGGNVWIKMDYTNQAGSGKSDIVAYIPESAFNSTPGYTYDDDTYVIAYVEYGQVYPNNDGFEELKVRKYPATKSGYKFEDLSADGNWDALEDPIEGWEIRAYVDTNPDGVLDQDEYDAGPAQLYDNGGDAINFTDENGAYSFLLDEGDYIIVEVLPSGWIQSPAGGNDSPSDTVVGTVTTSGEVLGELGYAVNLGNGELEDNNNFGNYQRGCLRVCKSLDTSAVIGPLADLPDGTFNITVTGPSYPSGTTLSFDVLDGVIDGPSCQDLNNLTPGVYNVTETSIPSGWVYQGMTGSPATVSAGDACGDVTVNVTNEPDRGCLRVCKSLDTSAVIGPLADLPDGTFNITVTGPSYPSGTTLSFPVVNGAISGPECQDLNNLTPGNYTAAETSIPSGWVFQGMTGSPATVLADTECGDVVINVTNEPDLGCLELEKVVDIASPADYAGTNFTIYLDGPSYATPESFVFTIDGTGAVLNPDGVTGPYCVCNLTPGDYTASETAPAGWVDPVITDTDTSNAEGTVTVAAGDACEDTVQLITVTNTRRELTCGTACAAQTAPGEFLFSDEQSNWFTWIYYDKGWGNESTPWTYPIYYGQDQLCGTLEVYDDGSYVYVRYNIDDMDSCVADSIDSYHLQVNDSFDALETIICPKKNPVPGNAQYTTPGADDWFKIGISGFGDTIYIFAHAIFCFLCP
jgi:hypothetical protein